MWRSSTSSRRSAASRPWSSPPTCGSPPTRCSTIEALEAEIRSRITPRRPRALRGARRALGAKLGRAPAEARPTRRRRASTKTPIDGKWLSYQIGQALDDDCVVFDDTIVLNQVHDYLQCDRPGSYFHNPASSGGWAPGAAFGAKLAAPDRDVVAITGDGFYMFASAIHSLWSCAALQRAVSDDRLSEPQLFHRHDPRRAQLSGRLFAAKAGYDGGYFDPPIDFAKEAEAAGAYGENVTDPAEVGPAIQRGLESVRNGTLGGDLGLAARYLQED